MSQASQLSPELARGLRQLARALLVGVRNWTLYPPEHPTVGISVSRLCTAIRESSLGSVFSIGITPETLMVEGASADASQSGIAEAAAMLHDRDLLRLTFVGDVPPEAVHALLQMLTLEPSDTRKQGGPARIWASAGHRSISIEQIDYEMEEVLVSYSEKPFVSEHDPAALDGAGGRAERMAATAELPPDLPDWMASLGQENVRRLSVTMFIDLFNLERDGARASEIAADLEALAEDLLLSGAYDDTLRVTHALARQANQVGAIGRDASLQLLDRLGDSLAMRETAGLIGEVDEAGWKAIRAVIDGVGIATVDALKPVLMVEEPSLASRRAEDAILGFGRPAVARLASLAGDSRWFVQRNGARLLGRIGAAEAVPLLQPMLWQSDPRVVREAVAALAAIDDPAAARAIHTVLRFATGALRRAVIDTLVTGGDPRVVPILVHILRESRPLGNDHEMVLETAKALGTVGSDEGVAALETLAGRRAFLGRKKLRAVKQHSVEALERIGGPKAEAALEEAARTGDRMLRKILGSKKG